MSSWSISKINNREVRAILKVAQAAGFTVELRKGGHIKVTSPTGAFIFMSHTPSDVRALHRVRSDLRRLGLEF